VRTQGFWRRTRERTTHRNLRVSSSVAMQDQTPPLSFSATAMRLTRSVPNDPRTSANASSSVCQPLGMCAKHRTSSSAAWRTARSLSGVRAMILIALPAYRRGESYASQASASLGDSAAWARSVGPVYSLP